MPSHALKPWKITLLRAQAPTELSNSGTSLAPLAFLACPVGMGAMMWMMMRGNKRQTGPSSGAAPRDSAHPASLELLREEHSRVSEEIDRLERSRAESAETTAR